MKRVLFVISVLLSLSMFCACSSDDDSSTTYNEADLQKMVETRMGSANQNNLPYDELPGWIQEWVQEKTAFVIKYKDYYKDFPETNLKIYQCKWKEKLFYFIPDILNSCYYCGSVYGSDGTMIKWNGIEEVADFCSNSTSWECIVEIKNPADM